MYKRQALTATLEGMFGNFDASCARAEKLERLAREINEIVMTAETQRQCGRFKKSIETYEKAFRISPHYSSWIKQHYTYALLQDGDLEAAKNYALEQTVHEHLSTGGNESFHAMLAYIYQKEGDENLAKEQEALIKKVTGALKGAWEFIKELGEAFKGGFLEGFNEKGGLGDSLKEFSDAWGKVFDSISVTDFGGKNNAGSAIKNTATIPVYKKRLNNNDLKSSI